MDAVFKLLSAHREFKPPAEEVARQPAHTQLECIGERVKPAAAAQGETDEEKLERVRKALSDAFVYRICTRCCCCWLSRPAPAQRRQR